MGLSLVQCSDKKKWDAFVAASPQGNVFCTTPFLDSLSEEYDLLLVEEGQQPRLGAVVIKRNGKPVRAPYPFTMYQGVLFEDCRALPHHKRLKWQLELIEFLLQSLEKQCERISWCLHPLVDDLRGFQWFHYHAPRLGKFQIELRYTGLLDIRGKDIQTCLRSMRTVRRQEYRHACDGGLSVTESTDIDALDHLHELTLQRQGIEREPEEARLLRAISIAALEKGFGTLFLCKDSQGIAVSASVFLYDAHCGYYLFGANHPEFRKTGSGTYTLVESIKACIARQLAMVDFVGINSPNRGDFKTSFNAAPCPYFIVTWEKPEA